MVLAITFIEGKEGECNRGKERRSVDSSEEGEEHTSNKEDADLKIYGKYIFRR